MSHRRIYLIEKFQALAATVVILAVVYFGLWVVVAPQDPLLPPVLLAAGQPIRLVVLLVAMLALAALAAVMTTHSRPEGALVAVLFGAAGISLRASSMHALLLRHLQELPGLYAVMMVELLVLAVLLAACAAVVDVVRQTIARSRPSWLWAPSRRGDDQSPPAEARWHLQLLPGLKMYKGGAGGRLAPAFNELANAASGLLLALVLLMLTLRSSDRNQVLFALVASFLVAALIAHQVFPSRFSITAWMLPPAAGVIFYALTAASVGTRPESWMHVAPYGYVLPIDWFAAGGGGAAFGYWISARLHELRHLERHQQTPK